MQDVRCLVGWHDYVEQRSSETAVPRVEGSLAVECTRCHKRKNMRIPGGGPSGPMGDGGAGSWGGA